ncbi:MAG: ATP-binding protein [Chlamydiales bacterium]|nr:ATP-binding protein [Chlamydiales bacterium]
MQAWSQFLLLQEEHFGKESIDKWLRPFKVVHFDSANLYLEASTSFEILWFEEHIRPIAKKSFFNENGRLIKIHISCSESTSPPLSKPKKRESLELPPLILTPDPLDPQASLDHFLYGENNTLILRFLSELLEEKSPLGNFNPLFFYGSSGVGKSHLLMALTHAFQKKKLKSLYVRMETFTEHVVKAIRSSQMHPFRDYYRSHDILLFDDVHILAKRLATQEELFHTFNALHTAGKQLIFTSSLPPSQLKEIEPRLISRFEWGIQFHLEPLEPELLKTFLIQRSDLLQCPLEEGAIDYILQSLPSRPISISKALDTLILRSHLSHSLSHPISKEIAEKELKELIEGEKAQKLSPEKIIAATASYFGIRIEDILGKSQIQEFSFARQIAIHLCRKKLNIPFMKVGSLFSKDHSTVMTSVKNIQKLLDEFDPKTRLAISTICRELEPLV